MNEPEQKAIMTLVLMAAFADGANDARERAAVTRVAESLPRGDAINVPSLYQDVLLKRASLEGAAAALTTSEAKRLAYELCVGVCDADGALGDAERAFLSRLQTALGFTAAEVS
jgi:tellurite resistance protein